MTIFGQGKLTDFFRYYDPSNKSHVNAILKLQEDIEETDPSLLTDSAIWVQLYRTPAETVQKTGKIDNSWSGITNAAVKAGARFPELLAAQWALESGFGKYPSAPFNYWGVKGSGRRPELYCTRKDTKEYIDGEWVTIRAWFKNFSSIQESTDYVVQRWYKDFKEFKGINRAGDREAAAQLLVKEGYATDPTYADKLIKLMDQYAPPITKNKFKPNLKLNVPFFSQLDSETEQGHRMCFSSSCAMALNYLLPGVLIGHKDDDYLSRVQEYGDTTDPFAQVCALESYGVEASFRRDLNLSDIEAQLRDGIPIPIGILHKGPSSAPVGNGHWIVVVGMDEDYLIVCDPFGEMDTVRGIYRNNTNGKNLKYPYEHILKRWLIEGDSSGWGIIIS
tara:strand:- start:569 stop:1741 length:1173 start_codon:yes stop_codon:yes gene_type:complete